MTRRSGVIAVVCAVSAAIALPATAGARTKIVYAGGPAGFQNTMQHKYGAGVNNFLLNKVTINQGDTVLWDGKSRAGGFHTIDLPAKGGGDLPLITADPGHPVTGVKDAANNPFWFNGQPSLSFDSALFTPTGGNKYDGSARIDSGLPLGPPKPFKVTFTKPGVYKYFCDVHYGMVGYVVVRAKGKEVPSATQDSAALKAQEKKYAATAKHVDKTTVTGDNVSLGASGAGGVEVFAMFPATKQVKVGTTVTFSMSTLTRETHTATFGDTSKNGYVTKLGQTAFNSPTGAIDPVGAYPSDVPPPISLDPGSHGNGFANIGALDRDVGTPLPPSGQITFTKAGTYQFICLIHPFMHGTVIVTP
jgi:plastocyanin